MDVDASGDVWVLGSVEIGGVNSDIATMELNPQGNLVWFQTYETTPGEAMIPDAIRHDSLGFCRIAVTDIAAPGGEDGLHLLEYSPTGQLTGLSFALYRITPEDVYFNNDGCCMAHAWDGPSQSDSFIQFDANYNLLNHEIGTDSYWTINYLVQADSGNHFWVATNLSAKGTFAYNVIGYDETATPTWGLNQLQTGEVRDLSVTDSNNIYVALGQGGSDYVAQMGSTGPTWQTLTQGNRVAADGTNGVVVQRQASSGAIYLDRLDTSGNLLWSVQTINPAVFPHYNLNEVTNQNGNILFWCTGERSSTVSDLLVQKYIEGPALSTVSAQASSSVSGAVFTGGVTYNVPVPSNTIVTLTSSNPTVVAVPQAVLIPQGLSQGAFQGLTGIVDVATPVLITAQSGGVQRFAAVTVQPAALTLLSVPVTSTTGGTSLTATVQLGGVTGINGRTLALKSSNTALATVPATVHIAPGQSRATFTVKTVSGGN